MGIHLPAVHPAVRKGAALALAADDLRTFFIGISSPVLLNFSFLVQVFFIHIFLKK